MNLAQRVVLTLTVFVIAGMALFPPWNYVYNFPGYESNRLRSGMPAYKAERFAGYHAIWQPNIPTDQTYLSNLFGVHSYDANMLYFSMRIDKDRLWLPIGGTLAIAMLLAVLFKSKN